MTQLHDTSDVIRLLDEVTARALAAPDRQDGGYVQPWTAETGIGAAAATAAQHATMGTSLESGARLRFLKRALLRILRVITREQLAYNAAVIDALKSAEQQVLRLQALVATTEVYREMGYDRLSQEATATQAAVRALAQWREADRSQLQQQRARVTLFLREMRRFESTGATSGAPAELNENSDDGGAMYVHLEERFRGTREDIKRRQMFYLPDVLPYRDRGLPLVDIGFGRAEWLELMREHGFPAYGVDTNPAFVETGTRDGFDARLGDGIAHLADASEGSVAAVTAFQVVEHIPFDALCALLDGALHSLMPDGLLLLETPNPANISVGATSFWLDPTHLRPIPSDFLAFLVEERGFINVEVRYPSWSEDTRLTDATAAENDDIRALVDTLQQELFGPRDYAVLARKPKSA